MPRCEHSLSVCDLGPGIFEVTTFGGCSRCPDQSAGGERYHGLAETAVFRFGEGSAGSVRGTTYTHTYTLS